MAFAVVSSGGVTHSVQDYRQVSPRSFGNRKFCGGRLELGRGTVSPRETAVKVSYDGRGRHVEVIGVGSRRDAVLDFCLESPYKAPALRLWTAVTKESTKLQLQQRLLEKGEVSRFRLYHTGAMKNSSEMYSRIGHVLFVIGFAISGISMRTEIEFSDC